MNQQQGSSEAYQRPMSRGWWLRRQSHLRFMVRELTSVFVIGYALVLIVLVAQAAEPSSFEAFVAGLRAPWSVALHLVALGMVVFHAVTWLALPPRMLAVWRGEHRVNRRVLAAASYLGWLSLSGVIVWAVVR